MKPGWYRVYLDGSIVCWASPAEVAEILQHFKCVVSADGFRTIDLL